MKFKTTPAPHVAPATSVRTVMLRVILATAPAGITHVVLFGPGLIVHLAVAIAAALLTEALCLRLRGRSPGAALNDLSAVVCAVLLAFCMPPLAPWYVTFCASALAIGVGKQAYGGIGSNLFNPAMVGYAIVLVAFPEAMTRWPPALGSGMSVGWGDSLAAIFARPQTGWDAVTMATPLDHVRVELGQMRMLSEIMNDPSLGTGFAPWLMPLAVLAGGAALLALKVIRWHLPVATIAGVIVCATVLRQLDSDHFAGPLFHLGAGSALFAAVFVVTDPVSCATSVRGRLIFGFGVGVLIVLIRSFGAYPDGVAFAVLLMNALVPLIDRVSVPRTFGHNVHNPDDAL